MMSERGIMVGHTTRSRSVQDYAPLMESISAKRTCHGESMKRM
jgi:transposase-like protein